MITEIYVKNELGQLVAPYVGAKLPFIVINKQVYNERVLSFIVSWIRNDIDMMKHFSLNSVPVSQYSNGTTKHTVGVLQYKKIHPGTSFKDTFSGLAVYNTNSREGYIQFLDSDILNLQKGDTFTIKTIVPGKMDKCSIITL